MSPIRSPSPGRAPLLLAIAVWLGGAVALGSLSACGRTEPTGRFAVVQRDFAWRPTARADAGTNAGSSTGPAAAPARAPLSRTWSFDAPQPQWTITKGAGTSGEGVLRLDGSGQVALAGPGRRAVDEELLHWLTLQLSTTTARSLQVSWRGGTPRTLPLQATGELETLTVALDSLKSVQTQDQAPDLVLTGVGEPDVPVQVRLARISLISDYEDAGDSGFLQAPLVRAGVRRNGVALRAPGEVAWTVPALAGDRLRFALAVVGGEQPVELVLSESTGTLPEQRFRCTPGAPWSEQALALDPAPPDAEWDFVLRATAPPDAAAVVLIGSPLLLRRGAEGEGGARTAQVVLYVEDTLRADHLQTLGYARPTDPHLRAIAAAGATFTHTWSSTNWTRPAVSSLLTGLDAIGHGNRGIEWRVADDLVTLGEALADAGCVTASFVTNHHAGSWSGLHQGFDAHADPAAFGSDAVLSTLTSSVIHAPIEAFLTEHADEAFFIYAHSLDPHAPYEADAQSLKELSAGGVPPAAPVGSAEVVKRIAATVPQYDGEIRHNDRELARLDAALAARGLTANTLLVFVSDHGEAFFDHGQWEHRQTLHEEEVRVPWVMRWPARMAAGARPDLPASLADVAPTILGLLERPLPPEWRGRDLSALCLGRDARLPPVPLLIDTLDVPPIPGRSGQAAVVAWPEKLVADVIGDGTLRPTALYRLDRDPAERHNLLLEADAPTQGSRVTALLGELRERLAAGPVTSAGAARAADVSPEVEAWMHAMGYLR